MTLACDPQGQYFLRYQSPVSRSPEKHGCWSQRHRQGMSSNHQLNTPCTLYELLGWKSHLRNWRSNITSSVSSPFTCPSQALNITSNVFRHSATTLGRHKTKWAKEPTKLWSDGFDELRGAQNRGGSMTVVENLITVMIKHLKTTRSDLPHQSTLVRRRYVHQLF